MDDNARRTPPSHQKLPSTLVSPSRPARKPRKSRVRFSLEPREAGTAAFNGGQSTRSSASAEPEASNLPWDQPRYTQNAYPSTALPGPSDPRMQKVRYAPESAIVSPGSTGNARQLYSVAPSYADQTQPPYAMTAGYPGQPQQSYTVAYGHPGHASCSMDPRHASQPQQPDTMQLGYAAHTQQSYTTASRYPSQPQHPYDRPQGYAGQPQQLYATPRGDVDQAHQSHPLAPSYTGQGQQPYSMPSGHPARPQPSYAMASRYTDQAQHSHTVQTGYTDQVPQLHAVAPSYSAQAQQSHTLPPGSPGYAQQLYSWSPGPSSQAESYIATQGNLGHVALQPFPTTPTHRAQWTPIPGSQPQPSFVSAPLASSSPWTSSPNNHIRSPGSETMAGPSASTPPQRKRPAEDPIPGGSGGPPSAKMQHQGTWPRESQRAPRSNSRLAKSCWRAFRSFEKKVKDLHQGYTDKRDRDKWELLDRELEFRRREPSMRGEYQCAFDSVTYDHERQRRYWKEELRTNERQWREIVQHEDRIWRSSYAELDRIWDTWVNGNARDQHRIDSVVANIPFGYSIGNATTTATAPYEYRIDNALFPSLINTSPLSFQCIISVSSECSTRHATTISVPYWHSIESTTTSIPNAPAAAAFSSENGNARATASFSYSNGDGPTATPF
ncbi:hypothetical protein AYO22_06580 [Fonsecaea multimorphosa]|nr:hypothetical protein AYO22_06580 [Fonsecaea multimorphosa]